VATGDPPRSVRVLLLRHAESTWNAQRRWQGQADPPLSGVGEQETRRAAASLGPVATVWTSHLVRARRTAELLTPPDVAVVSDRRLRERHVGRWAGLTAPEIERRYPGWLADGRRPDGWEPDATVTRRARAALDELVAGLAPGATALVVTHGGLIRAVATSLGTSSWPIRNLGGVWLHGDGDRLALGATMTRLGADDEQANRAEPSPVE
jgi:broad specificity phosphatase PhoE